MYRGIIVPLVTPLDGHGQVSKASVQRLITSLQGAVNGFMPALSSGEGWKLSPQQWRDMVAYTRAFAPDQPVLAGVQLPTTEAVLERSRKAGELGVDAVVVTTPFEKDLSQEAIYQHYATLREQTSLDIYIYNEAALSGNHIELETLLRICRLPGIVGIKDSAGSAEYTQQLVQSRPGTSVFQGWENLLLESPGVDGYVMPLANLEPQLCQEMLAEPNAEKQARINTLCERYGLFEDDWYRSLKQELLRRKILDSAEVVCGE